ncbi:hypothetical protein L9F63_007818, partial [Diploptera punctata]
ANTNNETQSSTSNDRFVPLSKILQFAGRSEEKNYRSDFREVDKTDICNPIDQISNASAVEKFQMHHRGSFQRGRGNGQNHYQENKGAMRRNRSRISNASSVESLNDQNLDGNRQEKEKEVQRDERQRCYSPNRNRQRKKFNRYPLENKNNNENDGLFNIPRRFNWLVQMSEMSGSDVATQLANSQSGFEEVIKNIQLMKDKPDMLVLILKLLAKIADADFKENKNKIFTQACDLQFLEQLTLFMADVAASGYMSRIFDINNFLKDILTFTKGVMLALPVTASERFKKILLMVDLFPQTAISTEIKNMKQSLQEQLKEFDVNQKDDVRVTSKLELLSAQAPPNSFREINLIPTVNDIFSRRPFVRPNIIKGSYTSIEHYLDVQFRLLHEDFLCPMREGISEYIHRKEEKTGRISNVRIYKKVLFLSPRVVADRVGIVVNFDPDKRMKKMNWKNSKRFMYGSLLCFTQDNFRSIMFGTVIEKNEKDLENGQIVVEMCESSQMREDLFQAQYTMAESEVYFEPYYQVLKALKEMKEEEFPMRHYIVEARNDVFNPRYLLENDDCLAEYVMEPDYRLPVLYPDMWPTAEQLKLDNSQYRAFMSALTREFVVIQGPPGTGKTFLGLKVAGVMLENSYLWNSNNQPILVVCYTNHALDQFLEGILHHTSKIVRVGGQSKSVVVNPFNLKELRRGYKKWMYDSKLNDVDAENKHLLRARLRMNDNLGYDVKIRLEQLVAKIKTIQVDLERIERNEGIISLNFLSEFIDQHHYKGFTIMGDKDEVLIEWLLSEYEDEVYTPQDELKVEGHMSDVEDEDDDILDEIGERITRDTREDLGLNVEDVTGKIQYCATLASMHAQRYDLGIEIENLTRAMHKNHDNVFFHSQLNTINRLLFGLEYKIRTLEQRLKERKKARKQDINRVLVTNDIWNLNFKDRWILYRQCSLLMRQSLQKYFKKLEEEFSVDARQYEEVRQAVDLEIMRDSLIVGMTTTGAARLQSLLKALKPKIVIVEEAAEVLESHILVSLTNHCEHLILIGDHKQLRPSPSVYRLAKEYNLDVSLFERMLNNGMHCEVLEVQHRMRPEIASLIVPAIYPHLINHMLCLKKHRCMGSIQTKYEASDTHSYRNKHEALFIVALCRHLVLQGYEPKNITILTTYAAQMFYIRNESKKYDLLKSVRITVVDNFQGEESDIILLSLVRSNKDANIGFLKIENRVCVALSRARRGMYIMGNMENLTRSSEIWPKIKEALQQQKAIGDKLELQCQVHPDQHKMVSKDQDFADIPDGGCTLECGALLQCGHTCQSVCHARDRECTMRRCRVIPCNRVMCVLDHKCQKYCYEECGLCKIAVQRQLKCGHEKVLECHVDYEKFVCQIPVKKVLPACKHEVDVPCAVDPAIFSCPIPCDARLDDCGHTCRRKCHVLQDSDHLDQPLVNRLEEKGYE